MYDIYFGYSLLCSYMKMPVELLLSFSRISCSEFGCKATFLGKSA